MQEVINIKSRKEIEDMYSFIGFFNDGQFMNQEYRKGIQHALSFVLFTGGQLENLKNKLNNQNKSEE